MDILFAGSPQIAVPSLRKISSANNVVAVLTNPPRRKGRRAALQETPVSAEANNLNIPVIEAEKIDSSVEEQVLSLQPELLAVVAYGTIFKKRFIDVFPRGGINLHPSLLPKYRGPSPIPAAILAGESVTGVTIQ
jgi:methionyl-tRNA formyltransferase